MQVVEGEPECFEKVVENGVQVPEETCSMEPTTECKNVTVRSVVNVIRGEEVTQIVNFCSIPNLVPEEKCRVIPKEACQTVFLNPTPTTVSR